MNGLPNCCISTDGWDPDDGSPNLPVPKHGFARPGPHPLINSSSLPHLSGGGKSHGAETEEDATAAASSACSAPLSRLLLGRGVLCRGMTVPEVLGVCSSCSAAWARLAEGSTRGVVMDMLDVRSLSCSAAWAPRLAEGSTRVVVMDVLAVRSSSCCAASIISCAAWARVAGGSCTSVSCRVNTRWMAKSGGAQMRRISMMGNARCVLRRRFSHTMPLTSHISHCHRLTFVWALGVGMVRGDARARERSALGQRASTNKTATT